MVDEPHEVVKLLLKRMESHPEEFKKDADRWDRVLVEVLEHADEAEIAAIHASVRNIRLGEAHEDMMEELCNGEERRAEERRQRKKAEERMMARVQRLQPGQYMQAQQNTNASQLGSYQNAMGIGISNGGTGATTGIVTASQPETTLSSSTISAIKKALGL